MKAQLVDSIRPGDWVYEIKFDSYRALALQGGRETRIPMSNERFRRAAHVARFVEWRHGIAEDLARCFVVKYIRESKVAYSAFAGFLSEGDSLRST